MIPYSVYLWTAQHCVPDNSNLQICYIMNPRSLKDWLDKNDRFEPYVKCWFGAGSLKLSSIFFADTEHNTNQVMFNVPCYVCESHSFKMLSLILLFENEVICWQECQTISSCMESSLNHSSVSVVAVGSNGSMKTRSVFACTTTDGNRGSFTSSPQRSHPNSPMTAVR